MLTRWFGRLFRQERLAMADRREVLSFVLGCGTMGVAATMAFAAYQLWLQRQALSQELESLKRGTSRSGSGGSRLQHPALRLSGGDLETSTLPPPRTAGEVMRQQTATKDRKDVPRLTLEQAEDQVSEFKPMADCISKSLDKTLGGYGVKPVVVAIAGGSGSGKTTLASAIFDELGEDHITFIGHGNYYRDLGHLPEEEREHQNFDHPDALETDLLYEHILRLTRGESVELPTYDFQSHRRMTGPGSTISATPRPIVLVEGVLVFTHASLLELFDIKIFVDTDADTRFIRRMLRDVRERGRSVSSVVDQYLSFVRPMHIKFVEPSKREADIIVPVGLNSVALDLLISRLRVAISDHDRALRAR
uniref:Uridine kinase n=1 Tax=Pinguiococcus pyrenoidosus TaxID=172671 RepID=A0A6U0T9P0_9STRA|mmetsp:Transcript_10607/g.39970  ORF Transcript_10607/g.39970 Transcript_10607/m.39970 type:complete len:363 (+) Transcript_10607:14-1102(+)